MAGALEGRVRPSGTAPPRCSATAAVRPAPGTRNYACFGGHHTATAWWVLSAWAVGGALVGALALMLRRRPEAADGPRRRRLPEGPGHDGRHDRRGRAAGAARPPGHLTCASATSPRAESQVTARVTPSPWRTDGRPVGRGMQAEASPLVVGVRTTALLSCAARLSRPPPPASRPPSRARPSPRPC
ncbi:hypothetical protein SAM9427_33140 [Streptomyces sp. ETH9427]|nr:hypothetical protein SAM9427_33140 [Streptomyces sp. ETH9427]